MAHRMAGKPFISVAYLSDNTVVAGGYDYNPFIFTESDGEWSTKGALDTGSKKVAKKKKGGAFAGAFEAFQGAATQGKAFGAKKEENLNTRHQNVISEIRPWNESSFSTCGMDGLIYFWDLNESY